MWENNKYFLSIYLFFFNIFLYFISLQILSVCLSIYYIYLYISTMPLSRAPTGSGIESGGFSFWFRVLSGGQEIPTAQVDLRSFGLNACSVLCYLGSMALWGKLRQRGNSKALALWVGHGEL